VIQFPCSACGFELKAADGTSSAAQIICDRCGAHVSIPAEAPNAIPMALPAEDIRSFGPSDDGGTLPEPAPDDDDVSLAQFDLPDPLPQELRALGEPVRNCPTANKTPTLLIAGGIVALVVFVFGMFFWVGRVSTGAARIHSPYALLIMILILLPVGAFLIWLGWAIDWQARVVLFRKGFAHFKRGTITVFPFDDVDGLWEAITNHYTNGVYTGTTHNYRIRSRGSEVSLNDVYPTIKWLGERIRDEVSSRQFNRAINTLNEGGTVRFGRLSVSPEGLGCDGSVLPWSDVEKVEIQQGIISVRKHGKWFNWGKVTVPEVPNVFVFIALVDNIIGINTKRR
jgi:hypothetical protein